MAGCSGTFQHCRSSHGHHCCGQTTDCFQLHLEEGAAKISPEFSADPAMCIWETTAGRGQLPAKRGSRAASTFCVKGAASSQCLQGAGGERYWVEVCATSLVRQSRSFEQLLSSWTDLQQAEETPVWNGAALSHFHPCCSGWIPKDAFSASNDVGLGRTGFSGRTGKPQDQRLTGTVRPVPWLLYYQHGCLQSLVLSKVTARLKPWVSYSTTISVCVEHFKVFWEDIFLPN